MPAVKKIDKDFVLSDSSVNVYGFRLRTEGYLMDEFLKNPIGYYGHDSKDGVLVRWEDVRLDGDKVLGKPVINMDHPRAARTINEIENDFLNAASIGKIVLLEYELEDNPEDPDNPIIAGIKWYNKETSLVDSPGNRSAFKVELFDINDKEINLTDITDFLKTSKMAKITLDITPELITLLGLDDKADSAAVGKRIKDLKDENDSLTDENTTLKEEAKTQEQTATAEEVTRLLQKGLDDKKLTVALKGTLAKDYAKNPKGLKDLIDAMPSHEGIVKQINKDKEKTAAKVKDLKDMSWEDLDRKGKLKDLKDNDYESYAEKFEAKYGRRPTA